ncbi:FAD-binding domain-containing protein [Paraphaeosphaeria sporulosa]|uniref:FAD-binding domain-containing protein n=1 Tax=Paraphaeosphaeria sporulosa TaxID=1460663 RepID=A0A177C2D7_9PLEO|nr:FAD-binding domain-containing protein [Paraphaeosphaeria sporulosa]OAG00897.1 FAD-binding domain-containing protein [Paraphaeosphaeria sporulosa]
MLKPAMGLGNLLPLLYLPFAFAQSLTQGLESPTGYVPCDALISAGFRDRILTASSPEYESRIQSWWSANTRYHPWCLFQPQTTREVSLAISTLAKAGEGAGDWHIAIRSGGHGWPGSNNVVKGVTIDLGHMNNSWYDDGKKVASLEPGAKWRDIYAKLLEKYNITVTGGRDGDVGVGGFLLGGGISYYTGTNGFGCDVVVNYELVLANGTIANANATHNVNLFKALKGGGPNFGIVTRFDVEAMPAVDLAYGQILTSMEHSDDVVQSLIAFTEKVEERPHDHMFVLYEHSPDINGSIILSVTTNTQGNMNTTSFDGFRSIPALSSSWESTSLAAAANASQVTSGYSSASATLTLHLTPSLLAYATTLHTRLTTRLTQLLGPTAFLASTIFQPMPTLYSTISPQKGGSMLPPFRTNSIMWTGGVGVTGGGDAALAIAEAELLSTTQRLEVRAREEGALEQLVYLNYAHPGQDALGSYGAETVKFMKGVAGSVDPGAFWQERVPGGFKLGRVV